MYIMANKSNNKQIPRWTNYESTPINNMKKNKYKDNVLLYIEWKKQKHLPEKLEI